MAPDSFKGTFDADEVAHAIAAGLARAGFDADHCPVADGGEGTLTALVRSRGGRILRFPTVDPLGRPIEGAVGLLSGGKTAVLEVASASGLSLLSEADRDPLSASTAGTGRLVVAALDQGARDVVLGAGGSATVDGGRGALSAIVAAGGLRGASLTVLCDVMTTWEDCARIFGPQKGAHIDDIPELERRLMSDGVRLPRDPRGVPMTGAAGGLAGGLWGGLGATLVSGASFVLDAVQFDQRLVRARAVITGEGRLDRQSAMGKLVGEIAGRAAAAQIPAHVIAGSVDLREGDSIRGVSSIQAASTLSQITSAARAVGGQLRESDARQVSSARVAQRGPS